MSPFPRRRRRGNSEDVSETAAPRKHGEELAAADRRARDLEKRAEALARRVRRDPWAGPIVDTIRGPHAR